MVQSENEAARKQEEGQEMIFGGVAAGGGEGGAVFLDSSGFAELPPDLIVTSVRIRPCVAGLPQDCSEVTCCLSRQSRPHTCAP